MTTATDRSTRVLVVDDEENITFLLGSALRHFGFDVTTAATGRQGLDAVRSNDFDLVLLDVMLPDGSGYDVCRELRAASRVPIIMLTARGEETDRIVGLELGADDYIVKPFSAREVVARIRAVLRRSDDQSPQADGPIEIGPLRLDRARRGAALDGDELDLTRKEFELLELLMSKAGTVITRERLIDEVWDVNWFGSTKTLDVHVSGLRRKLGDSSRSPRFIHTVRGVGFRFAGPEELGSEP
jgi:two-component system response regulator RegX3